MAQRFFASESYTFPNGAVGYRPGGPFDCLGPYAKVTGCPIVLCTTDEQGRTVNVDTGLRRTCYATSCADTFFSVPACTRIKGRHVSGFFALDDSGGIQFFTGFPIDARKACWCPVREPNVHGSRAVSGNRSALVARVEPGAWVWFAERDGRTVVTGDRGIEYRSEWYARRHAEGYLTTGRVGGRNYDELPLAAP